MLQKKTAQVMETALKVKQQCLEFWGKNRKKTRDREWKWVKRSRYVEAGLFHVFLRFSKFGSIFHNNSTHVTKIQKCPKF